MTLRSKVVVVTGSTRGIGRGVAAAFAQEGARLVIHGRDLARADAVLAELRGFGADVRLVVGDLVDASTCRDVVGMAVRTWGQIDLLVNNAGNSSNYFTGVMDTSIEQWQQCMDLNLRAAWICAKEAVPFMPRGSAIVTIGSDLALSTCPGWFPYNVAKAGVLALNQSLAVELAPMGIRANAILPGYIDRDLDKDRLDRRYDKFADPEAERDRLVSMHPLGRAGTPNDIARMVRFLGLEEESGFVTGTSVVVDGGRSALAEDPRSPEQRDGPGL